MKDNEYVHYLAKAKSVTDINSLSDTYAATVDGITELKKSVEENKKKADKKFKSTDDKLSRLIKDTKGLNQANIMHECLIGELLDKSEIMKDDITEFKRITDLNTVDILVLHIHLKNLLMYNVLFIYVVLIALMCALTKAGTPISFTVAVGIIIAVIGFFVKEIRTNVNDNINAIENHNKEEDNGRIK